MKILNIFLICLLSFFVSSAKQEENDYIFSQIATYQYFYHEDLTFDVVLYSKYNEELLTFNENDYYLCDYNEDILFNLELVNLEEYINNSIYIYKYSFKLFNIYNDYEIENAYFKVVNSYSLYKGYIGSFNLYYSDLTYYQVNFKNVYYKKEDIYVQYIVSLDNKFDSVVGVDEFKYLNSNIYLDTNKFYASLGIFVEIDNVIYCSNVEFDILEINFDILNVKIMEVNSYDYS